jgi:multiple sugar transport system substrate-binding protein
MIHKTTARSVTRATVVAATLATALVLAGCSSNPAPSAGTTAHPTQITFWTWGAGIQKTVDLFEKAHPEIHVKVENVGVGADEYTKLQNAVNAGSGGPDVAQMDDSVLPNFALTGALADLTKTGGSKVSDLFLSGTVDQVKFGSAIYGVPQDTGPGVMFYRKDIFDKAGLSAPTTWAEYEADAVKIHAMNAQDYVTFMDPTLTQAAYGGLWQLQANPWSAASKSDVTLNLTSKKAVQWANYWTDLNDKGLTVDSTQGSSEWFNQLGAGQIATWVTGAWGLQALTGTLPDNSGLWRVAPIPVWKAGDTGTAQYGGGADVVMNQSKNKAAATTFALWLDSSPTALKSLEGQGLLPAAKAAWNDKAYMSQKVSYLGGQQANQIFSKSASETAPGWSWLPFQPYVDTEYTDIVGQAITQKTSLAASFATWQTQVAAYAKQQGFKVTIKK